MAQSRTGKALFLSSGQVLAASGSIALAALLSRVFDKQGYAAYRQTVLMFAVAGPLLALGLPHGLYYFLPRVADRSRKVVTAALLALVVMGLAFAVVLWFLAASLATWFENPLLAETLKIYAPYALFALPALLLAPTLMSAGRARTLALYNVLSRTGIVCVVTFFAWNAGTPAAATRGLVLATGGATLGALVLIWRHTSGRFEIPPVKEIRRQVHYSVPVGLATMLATLTASMDKIVVAALCEPEDFAVYANGAMEIPLVVLVTASIYSVLMPDLVRFNESGNRAEALAMWGRAATKYARFLFPVMFFCLAMAPEIMRFLFSTAYEPSASPFRLHLLLLPVRCAAWGSLLMAAGDSRRILWIALAALPANLCLSVPLVLGFGYNGAAVATVLTMYCLTVPLYGRAIRSLYDVDWNGLLPWKSLARIAAASGVSTVVCILKYALPGNRDFLQICLTAAAFVSVLLMLYHLMGIVRLSNLRDLRGFVRRHGVGK